MLHPLKGGICVYAACMRGFKLRLGCCGFPTRAFPGLFRYVNYMIKKSGTRMYSSGPTTTSSFNISYKTLTLTNQ